MLFIYNCILTWNVSIIQLWLPAIIFIEAMSSCTERPTGYFLAKNLMKLLHKSWETVEELRKWEVSAESSTMKKNQTNIKIGSAMHFCHKYEVPSCSSTAVTSHLSKNCNGCINIWMSNKNAVRGHFKQSSGIIPLFCSQSSIFP